MFLIRGCLCFWYCFLQLHLCCLVCFPVSLCFHLFFMYTLWWECANDTLAISNLIFSDALPCGARSSPVICLDMVPRFIRTEMIITKDPRKNKAFIHILELNKQVKGLHIFLQSQVFNILSRLITLDPYFFGGPILTSPAAPTDRSNQAWRGEVSRTCNPAGLGTLGEVGILGKPRWSSQAEWRRFFPRTSKNISKAERILDQRLTKTWLS